MSTTDPADPSIVARVDQLHARESELCRTLLGHYREMLERYGPEMGHSHFVVHLVEVATMDSLACQVGALLHIIDTGKDIG